MLPDVPLLVPLLLDGVRMIDSVPPDGCGLTLCCALAGAALATMVAAITNIRFRIPMLLNFQPPDRDGCTRFT